MKGRELALQERAQKGERRAARDVLTGLANRRAFTVALERALSLAARGTPAALLYLDIDGFKRCNDERGHAFGDEVLTRLASLLKQQLRAVDLLARLGGDEFAALLTGSGEADAVTSAQRLCASVTALGVEIGIPLDLSVGIAGLEAGASAAQSLASADSKMYEYKAAHRRARTDAERP
jgi:diguanylate cyclase (GGDEF)-like protein